MPQIAKYKALGGSIGAYKKTLSDIQSKEYAKDFASYKDVQRRSMYGAIGGTVANIIGIAQEVKGIKKLKGYAESAKGLSGVEERDGSYYSRISGKELSQEQLQSIGYMESLGIGTKYSEYEIPESNIVETKGGFKSIDAGETLDFPRRDLDLSDEILSNKEMETSPSISSNVNIEEPIVSPQKEDKPFDFFAQKDIVGEQKQYTLSSDDAFDMVKGGEGLSVFGDDKFKVDRSIIERVIGQESSGISDAVSEAGASGLMGVMPGTAKDPGLGVKPFEGKLTDVKENVRFGTDYLNALYNRFEGDIEKTLMAYNWGYGNVKKMKSIMEVPKETRDYVDKVLGRNHIGTSYDDEKNILKRIRTNYRGIY